MDGGRRLSEGNSCSDPILLSALHVAVGHTVFSSTGYYVVHVEMAIDQACILSRVERDAMPNKKRTDGTKSETRRRVYSLCTMLALLVTSLCETKYDPQRVALKQ